jgi:enoyl-CoA hydratase
MDLKAAAIGERARTSRRGGFGIMARPPLKPVIAAIEGHAYAGGLELALSCDLIVASEESQFALMEVKRGLVATGGGCFRLHRRIPYHLAMEMVLTAEPRTAAEMREHGLLAKVTTPGKALEAALDLARKVIRNAPIAVRASKEIVSRSQAEGWTDEESWTKQLGPSERNAASEDKPEGLAAFAQKRPPIWKNR